LLAYIFALEPHSVEFPYPLTPSPTNCRHCWRSTILSFSFRATLPSARRYPVRYFFLSFVEINASPPSLLCLDRFRALRPDFSSVNTIPFLSVCRHRLPALDALCSTEAVKRGLSAGYIFLPSVMTRPVSTGPRTPENPFFPRSVDSLSISC